MKPRCIRYYDTLGVAVICPDCDGADAFIQAQEKIGRLVRADYCSFHEEINLLDRLNGESDA